MKALQLAAVVLALVCAANATIYFHEEFNTLDQWTPSAKKDDYGKLILSSGEFFGDEAINRGAKTSQDAKFYAASTEFPTEITNEAKEIVFSLSVKHEQGLDCGGGYVKFLPKTDPKEFHGDSEYWLMFGPDQCGYNKKIHIIFNYNGKNLLWKKEPKYPDDKFTHVHTLRVKPDNSYEYYQDQELKESGKLEEDWDFLPPKMIDDPNDKKPSDWVDNAQIDDPEDKKPEDWDKEPATIADPEAKKPDDWDDEEDGAWEAPQIPNPKSKGTWRAKRIPNPAYKGVWKAKQIENPEYKPDDKLYLIRKPLKHVGIDVWQVKSGSIFDNIIVGDNLSEVNELIDKTWKATKDAEKKAEEAKKKKEEDDRKAEDDKDDEKEL